VKPTKAQMSAVAKGKKGGKGGKAGASGMGVVFA